MATKTITSDAQIFPADPNKSTLCDGRIVDQIVEDFGVYVRIRVYGTTTYNHYGDSNADADGDYTESNILAYITQWTKDDEEVAEGMYENGEITFLFKIANETKVIPGNLIFFESEWYKIISVMPRRMGSTTYQLEARVEKKLIKE